MAKTPIEMTIKLQLPAGNLEGFLNHIPPSEMTIKLQLPAHDFVGFLNHIPPSERTIKLPLLGNIYNILLSIQSSIELQIRAGDFRTILWPFFGTEGTPAACRRFCRPFYDFYSKLDIPVPLDLSL